MSISILAIGHDKSMNDWLKGVLTERCYKVKSANTTVEGMNAVRYNNPDIIILDLVSPDMEGLQLCWSILCLTKAPNLVLSALNTPSMGAKVLDEGADDFLSKPVNHCVLIAHLKTLMRRMRYGHTAQLLDDCYLCG